MNAIILILTIFSLLRGEPSGSIKVEETHREEIRYDSYKKSLKMMENAPVSLENAFLIAMREEKLHNDEIKEAVVNPSLLGVRTKGDEYFFIIDRKSKLRDPREIGVYVSAINGSSRFVLNKNKYVTSSPLLGYIPSIINQNEEKAYRIIWDRFNTMSQEYFRMNAH